MYESNLFPNVWSKIRIPAPPHQTFVHKKRNMDYRLVVLLVHYSHLCVSNLTFWADLCYGKNLK